MKKLVLFLILAALLMVACATATPEATDAPAEETDAPATEAAAPSGKITLWGWSYDVMQTPGLIEAFNEEYPDVEVEIVTYQSGDNYQNLTLACSSGEGAPDVVQIENLALARYVHTEGCLHDITEEVTPMLDDFNDYKWIDAEKDGKYYAVPWDSGPVVMYYRTDVFEQAGLPTDSESVSELVSTWDGYLEVCQTIKDETGLNCFSHSRANNDAHLYDIALWQQGLGYYDDEGNITVDSAENVATLEELAKFWDAEVTTETQPFTDPWYAELSSVDTPVATIVEASWLGVFLKTWIAGETTSGRWGVAYMPAMEEGQPRAANSGGSTLAIPEQSDNKDAAWAFIEFMLARKENQLAQFAYSDFLPALETTYTDAIFNEPDEFFSGQTPRQIYLDVAQQIPAAHIYGPNHLMMHGHVATAIQKFATGELTAAEALAEAAEAIKAELE
jgi:lactose/L-arabinose transport system substrate-binding protein